MQGGVCLCVCHGLVQNSLLMYELRDMALASHRRQHLASQTVVSLVY